MSKRECVCEWVCVCVCVCVFDVCVCVWCVCVCVLSLIAIGCVNATAVWRWRHKGGWWPSDWKANKSPKRKWVIFWKPCHVAHTDAHSQRHGWSWSDVRPATGSGSLRKHSLAKHDPLTQWENPQSPATIAGFSAQFGLSAGRFASDVTVEVWFFRTASHVDPNHFRCYCK